MSGTLHITTPRPSERELFLQALEKPPSERLSFIAGACAGDDAQRKNLEELLRAHDTTEEFLRTPALDPQAHGAKALELSGGVERPGDRIGRYKLLEAIGEGGCGTVYMAEQEEPVRRRVALKIIKLGMDTRSVIARFEAERQALAMMDHPNIARVLDGGATERGRPFFVMELVRGVRITDYCDNNQLSTDERLRLFMRVCAAIQHAHQKGIIHRDIKPSNILVTLQDGVAVPKVIDFGIAKATEQPLTDKTLFTAFHSFIGTPAYMSPEQAEMTAGDADTRSDIYSLGVLLYEMLTGTTPFDARELTRMGLDECRRTIQQGEPARPSTRLTSFAPELLTQTAQRRRTEGQWLVNTLRGDLDWIVMKCLEKDRARRYDTAAALALDVQRFLENEAVLARPPTALYQLQKLMARHRVVATAAAAVFAVLVAGITISTWQAIRATRAERAAESAQLIEFTLRQQSEWERERAEQESAAARLNEYVADINLARQSMAAGNYGRALQLLNKHRPLSGQADLRSFEWRYLWQLTQGAEHENLPRMRGAVDAISVAPSGEFAAIVGNDRSTVINLRTRTAVYSTQRAPGTSASFLADGRLLTGDFRRLRAVNTSDWSERALSDRGLRLAAAGGSRIVAAGRDGLRVLSADASSELATLPNLDWPIAFSPDGSRLAASHRESGAIVVTHLDGRPSVTLDESTNLFVKSFPRKDRAVAFDSAGKVVIAARNMPTEHGVFVLGLWNAETGREIAVMPDDPQHVEHTGSITAIALSRDGQTVATASMDHSIRLWDLQKRQSIAAFHGHVSEVWAVAFTPDGQKIISGAKDGSIKIWPLQRSPKDVDETIFSARLPLGISPDGRTLAAMARNGDVLMIDLESGSTVQEFKAANNRLAPSRGFFGPIAAAALVSADLNTLVMPQEGSLRVWNTQSGESYSLTNLRAPAIPLALSPDGNTLLANPFERGLGRLRWIDLPTGEMLTTTNEAGRAWFSPDGKRLVTVGRGNRVDVWDAAAHVVRTNFVMDAAPAGYGTFSPDGKTFAIVCQDDVVRLYDVETVQLLGSLVGHKQAVQTVVFAPDGKTIASGSDDSTIKFWNVATHQELLTVRRLGGAPRGLTFSKDGTVLVAGSSSTIPGAGIRVLRAPAFAQTDVPENIESDEDL